MPASALGNKDASSSDTTASAVPEDAPQQQQGKKPAATVTGACDACKRSHHACNQERPKCSRCVRLSGECSYQVHKKPGRKRLSSVEKELGPAKRRRLGESDSPSNSPRDAFRAPIGNGGPLLLRPDPNGEGGLRAGGGGGGGSGAGGGGGGAMYGRLPYDRPFPPAPARGSPSMVGMSYMESPGAAYGYGARPHGREDLAPSGSFDLPNWTRDPGALMPARPYASAGRGGAGNGVGGGGGDGRGSSHAGRGEHLGITSVAPRGNLVLPPLRLPGPGRHDSFIRPDVPRFDSPRFDASSPRPANGHNGHNGHPQTRAPQDASYRAQSDLPGLRQLQLGSTQAHAPSDRKYGQVYSANPNSPRVLQRTPSRD